MLTLPLLVALCNCKKNSNNICCHTQLLHARTFSQFFQYVCQRIHLRLFHNERTKFSMRSSLVQFLGSGELSYSNLKYKLSTQVFIIWVWGKSNLNLQVLQRSFHFQLGVNLFNQTLKSVFKFELDSIPPPPKRELLMVKV